MGLTDMQIDRVTITGADDSTDIDWMCLIQERYPFVEWGILVSQSQMGSYRFPSGRWMNNLTKELNGIKTLKLSVHVCDKWVRQICQGDWSGLFQSEAAPLTEHADRIQLNFHAYAHKLDARFFVAAHQVTASNYWQLIFQIDGVNDALLQQAREHEINAVPLYDLSGGAGVLPSQWPKQQAGVYTGYAGGLGPRNVMDQIEKIREVANGRIWIDMETRVRTEDDSRLDESLVESVLEQCSSLDCVICHS